MNLKQARAIARKVGATIQPDPNPANGFQVRTHCAKPDGDPHLFYCPSEFQAAHTAVIETAKAAKALFETAKRVYVEDNLLFSPSEGDSQ